METSKTAKTQFQDVVAGAAPDESLLVAWPTISRAAGLIGKSASVLGRAMDSDGVPKHLLGRRDKKIAPTKALHYARIYGADVDAVADALMQIAEESGAPVSAVASVEQDIGAWMAGRARRAARDDDAPSVQTLMAAVKALTSAEDAEAIFAEAGIAT